MLSNLQRAKGTKLRLFLLLIVFVSSLFNVAMADHPNFGQLGDAIRLAQMVEQDAKQIYRIAESRGTYLDYSARRVADSLRELLVRAESFRRQLEFYRNSPQMTKEDFRFLNQAYQSALIYENYYSDYLYRSSFSNLKLSMERLGQYYRVSSGRFDYLRVLRLASQIGQTADQLRLDVEADLRRYARYGGLSYEERESLRAVEQLARAARHLEGQVRFNNANSEATRHDAQQVVAAFKHAEASISYLALSERSRASLYNMSSLVYELESIYGDGRVGPGRDSNDPFGRGGSYGGYNGGRGDGHHGGYGPIDNGFDPCLDPYACSGGRGPAPTVRIF